MAQVEAAHALYQQHGAGRARRRRRHAVPHSRLEVRPQAAVAGALTCNADLRACAAAYKWRRQGRMIRCFLKLRRLKLHGGARRRAGDACPDARRRRADRARRPDHAVRRSRRRQDHLRARAHPPSRRRRNDRSAEPDLHVDAGLRAAAFCRGACRSLPAVGAGRTRRARLRRISPSAAWSCSEWPDRAAGFLPADRLDIAFTLSPQHGETFRQVRVTGYGTLAARAERIAAIRSFLNRSGFARPRAGTCRATPRRAPTSGSPSTASAYILMNSPPRPDGPPVRDGKPYSAIAHLAENVTPFIAMAQALRERGFSAPAIIAADREAGPAGARGSGQRGRGAGRSAGADRGALRGGGRCAGRAARHARCPTYCRSSRASITGCRATTWRRC